MLEEKEKLICAGLQISEAAYLSTKAQRNTQFAGVRRAEPAPQRAEGRRTLLDATISRMLGPIISEARALIRSIETGTPVSVGQAQAQASELTEGERKLARLTGMSHEAFLEARSKVRSAIVASRDETAAAKKQFGLSRVSITEFK